MSRASTTSSQALRVSTAPSTRLDDDPTLIVDPAEAQAEPPAEPPDRVLLGAVRRRPDGVVVREVVVDGWRIEVELELERRASLRERASRASHAAGTSGPTELRAVIPGRIVAVSVAIGDTVAAGQQVLVVEAMKMQNELRAPRAGIVEQLAPAVGQNVEVGDLLMVIT